MTELIEVLPVAEVCFTVAGRELATIPIPSTGEVEIVIRHTRPEVRAIARRVKHYTLHLKETGINL